MATPRDAATVLVLRESSTPGGAPEIFFVKRNAGARFMGGAYVFPGGRLDPGDADPDLPCDLSQEQSAARLNDPDPVRARALHVAALRECLEESGMLFATHPLPPAQVRELRSALTGPQPHPFRDVLHGAGVTLQASALVPYARWVTPRAESRRFDARFFLARCPTDVDATAVHDGGETVASAWLTARDALDRAVRREIVLAPPTWRTLEALGHHSTLPALLTNPHGSMDPVEPTVAMEDGQPVVILPESPRAPTCRFRYDDGAWIPAG